MNSFPDCDNEYDNDNGKPPLKRITGSAQDQKSQHRPVATGLFHGKYLYIFTCAWPKQVAQ
jgi:hypothetical protein